MSLFYFNAVVLVCECYYDLVFESRFRGHTLILMHRLRTVQRAINLYLSMKEACEDGCLCKKMVSFPVAREKLRVGGNQLMELKGALDGCIGTTVGQQHLFTT